MPQADAIDGVSRDQSLPRGGGRLFTSLKVSPRPRLQPARPRRVIPSRDFRRGTVHDEHLPDPAEDERRDPLDRQCRRSFSVRNTPSRESTVFGPAAISMLWSCGSDVTCGSWSGSSVSHLVVFSGRRDVRRRSMPELWKTEAEALLCVLFVFSFKLRGVSVNWVCTVYFYAI